MKKTANIYALRGHSLVTALGITVLALVMLMSITCAAPFAYIPNSKSNTVSVIDTATNTITATVPVGNYPNGVAVSPDGSKAYIANWKDSTVSVIDTASFKVTTFSVPSGPEGIVISPDGKKAYVANRGVDKVSVVDTATNKIIDTVSLPAKSALVGIAVSPDGKKVYTANGGLYSVSVIDTATKSAKSLSIPGSPINVVVGRDGKKVYVSTLSGMVYAIDTATNNVKQMAKLGELLWGVDISPDGKKLYVTDNSLYGSNVAVIDTATNQVTTVSINGDLTGVSVTPDGKKVYVTDDINKNVHLIDTATNKVTLSPIPVGNGPLPLGHFIGPLQVNDIIYNNNWAGYSTTGSLANPQSYSYVKANWIVPGFPYPYPQTYLVNAAIWIGLGGSFVDNTHVLTGTTIAQIGLKYDQSGIIWHLVPVYQMFEPGTKGYTEISNAISEKDGKKITPHVYTGDKIYAEVNYSAGKYKLYLQDLTQKWHTDLPPLTFIEKSSQSERYSAEWIVERIASSDPKKDTILGNFNPITFTNCATDYGPITSKSIRFVHQNVLIKPSESSPETSVSAIDSTGTSFTVNFNHN